MTVDIWMVAVLGALWFVTVCYIAHLKSKYTELEIQFEHYKETHNKVCEDQANLHKKIESIEEDLEKTKGSIQVCVSTSGKRFGEIEHELKDFKIYITDHLQSVYNSISLLADDTDKKVNEKPISEVEYWADKAMLADIVDPSNLEPPEKEEQDCTIDSPTYRWIFPSEEPDHEERLIFGQWYTVIGILSSKLKSDGSPMITTQEALWNRYKFISIDDEPFDTVYAYIRMPSSADIMEKVVQMALHGE